MATIKVKARIDQKGILTAALPIAAANQTVDVLVDFPAKDPAAESEFLVLLAKSFGMLPGLQRVDQGELPAPKSW